MHGSMESVFVLGFFIMIMNDTLLLDMVSPVVSHGRLSRVCSPEKRSHSYD